MNFLNISFGISCLLLLITNIKSNEEVKEFIEKSVKECQQETKATDEDISKILAHEPSSTYEAKCMNACLLKKMGVVDSSGKLDKEMSLKHTKVMADGDAEKEKVLMEAFTECAKRDVPADHCEAGEIYILCYNEHLAAKGYDPKKF